MLSSVNALYKCPLLLSYTTAFHVSLLHAACWDRFCLGLLVLIGREFRDLTSASRMAYAIMPVPYTKQKNIRQSPNFDSQSRFVCFLLCFVVFVNNGFDGIWGKPFPEKEESPSPFPRYLYHKGVKPPFLKRTFIMLCLSMRWSRLRPRRTPRRSIAEQTACILPSSCRDLSLHHPFVNRRQNRSDSCLTHNIAYWTARNRWLLPIGPVQQTG